MVPKRHPRMTGKIVDAEKKDHAGRAIGQIHDATENRLAGRLYPQPHLLAVSDRHPGPRLHKVGKALGEDVARRVTHCDSKICAR